MHNVISYHSTGGYIEVKIQGSLTLNAVRDITLEVMRLAKEQDCFLVLGDYREMTVANLSTVDIYDVPKIITDVATASGLPVHKFKRALVVAQDLDDFSFFETVTLNRGQNVKIFQDMAEARKWLTGK